LRLSHADDAQKEVAMQRAHLRMIEILVWTVGAYLLVCLLTRPPQAWVTRITSRMVVPPVVMESPHRDFTGDAHPLRLLPDPRLRAWKEQTAPGSQTLDWQVIGRPDIPRMGLWALGISAVTMLLAVALRRLRRLLPEPPAFPVEIPLRKSRLLDAK
jgi:hypothetical protein